MMMAFFFVIVLALETEWQRPYHELIELWTLGAFMVGLCALPSGWLADRWSAPRMMAVMFFGMGMACVGCAMADSPKTMLVGLAVLGAFASIYHPVGVPWIVRNSRAKGKALGVNGIFGGLGMAASGVVTGLLIDWMDWRAAFVVPGLASTGAGLGLAYSLGAGHIVDSAGVSGEQGARAERGVLRGVLTLLFTMFSLGFVYQVSQASLPKLFDLRLGDWVGTGTMRVGLIVSVVYAVAAVTQLLGGHLADHYPLKTVYLLGLGLQVPALLVVSTVSGLPLVASAMLALMLSTASLPAENMLLVHYSPRRHQSLVFGLKFVVALGTAPLAIAFVARILGMTGDFSSVFVTSAALTGLAFAVASTLPGVRRNEQTQ
jgi:MFS family permease